MRLKVILGAGLLFAATLFLTFPYDTLARYQLSKSCPDLRYSALTASWRQLRLVDVRAPAGHGRNLLFDEVRLSLAGIFPPALRVELSRMDGRANIRMSGNRTRVRFEADVAHFPVQDAVSPFLTGLKWSVSARGSGEIDVTERCLLPGSRITAESSGELLETSPWSSLWGRTIQEAGCVMETRDGAVALSDIKFKSDHISFEGAGLLSPLTPPKSARLELKGQAVLSGHTVAVDKSIPVGEMLSAD